MDAANPHQGWSQSRDLGSTLRESGCKLTPLHSSTARLGTNMQVGGLVHGQWCLHQILQAVRLTRCPKVCKAVPLTRFPLLICSLHYIPGVYNIFFDNKFFENVIFCSYIWNIYILTFWLEFILTTRSSGCYVTFLLAPAKG